MIKIMYPYASHLMISTSAIPQSQIITTSEDNTGKHFLTHIATDEGIIL